MASDESHNGGVEMKILHTADWHLGTFRIPVKDGVNLRTEDTKRCLDELIRVANEEKPDYSLVSGDIFQTMMDQDSSTSSLKCLQMFRMFMW